MNKLGKRYFYAAALAGLFLLMIGINKPSRSRAAVTPTPEPQKDSLISFTLCVTGDLMCHMPQANNAKTSDSTYDFNPAFAEIAPFLSSADMTIGNLETTCAGSEKGYSGYPQFNSPDEYVAAIKNAGFDLLVTANNHSMDTEENGLLRTLNVVKKNNLYSTGTYSSAADRDSIRMLNMNGIKSALLNYTYGTNGLLPSEEHKFMLNVIDTLLLEKDINSARQKGAEIVIVYFHFGTEYMSDPTEAQKSIEQKAIAYGADIILGAHPHVVGPVQFFKPLKSKLDSGLVAWSLGNFISNQSQRYTDAGVLLNLHFTKHTLTDSISLAADFIPTWVYRGTNPAKKMHIVFPAEKCTMDSIAPFIGAEEKVKMQQAFDDVKTVMTKYSSSIKLKSIKEK